ncbi:hypothetical protein NQ317_000923 [Molorchus minor]|uniref:RRM domain-containing protein n=1 Tax=Molorchus minor TaxID=1323400 RepID=A0ABQ9K2U0_9CUCU|nr:hypothetical protein NQ317_000923 [Molorchus minor]
MAFEGNMEQQNNPDTTNVKVESSTNDNNAGGGQERSNNFQGRRGGGGDRFGRGGRFGGRGGGNRETGQDVVVVVVATKVAEALKKKVQMLMAIILVVPWNAVMVAVVPKINSWNAFSKYLDTTFEIPAVSMIEKKFNGRNRLYIGNIGSEVTEDDITDLFKPYGETAEIFLNKEKNFGFIKVDYHSNAEKAKRELDGTVLKSRNLKIRFAPNSATVKVKNLTPFTSNELLHYAFSLFGEIERATVQVDERGKPTGEGIIDFARKGSALHAIRKCAEGCFFLTGSLRPVIVESFEIVDDIDGYSDKNLPKKSPEYHKEREVGPRFALPGSFENEYGMRWKQLFDLHSQKEEALKKELDLEKEKLEAQMEYAKYEHETEVLRDQLRARELDKERQKREWEMKERQVEEERLRTEEQMRRTQEEMESRILQQQEDLRRRQQENNLFMQAHNLDSLLEQQEQAYDQPSTGYSHCKYHLLPLIIFI